MNQKNDWRSLPLLPLKEAVLFPTQMQPVVIGRPKSLAAVEAALSNDGHEVFVVAQRSAETTEPTETDVFGVGTRAVIKKVTKFPNGPMQVVLQGQERAVLLKIEEEDGFLKGRIREAPVEEARGAKVEALEREVRELTGRLLELTQSDVPAELKHWITSQEGPVRTAYFVASMLTLELEKEQAVLEAGTLFDLFTLLHTYLAHEVHVVELRKEISSRAEREINDEQRRYMLRQQMRAIQEELGEGHGETGEVQDLQERFAKTEFPETVRKEVEREFQRLERLQPSSPEYGVVRGYLEFVLDLPWSKRTENRLDLAAARQVLSDDHCGLEEVKERILEHLGVLKLNPKAKAPILCFVGPPGVGKTSLGQSIARALQRDFERSSLGGVSDEAELRGHRRTYIGAMPGRILQALRRSGSSNPVLMLDEVDKLGRDFRGDPAAALLEVLDPEQNHEFRDNYLDLPFDLSSVFFVLTANTLETIPAPLLDRLEVIRFSGYSDEEKRDIARTHLLPRQMEDVGVSPDRFALTDEALEDIISGYTREAGVRQLGRELAKVLRKVALRFAENEAPRVEVTRDNLAELLGPRKLPTERGRLEMPPGVAQGLAWTPSGGELLYVEATLLPEGKGLTLTGQLGDVMRESATAAQSYIWSHADELGLQVSTFKKNGLHVHVPAGATPKDGPSAGITIATALASLYSGRAIRKDTAMTGEVTLTGLVLPVGGIKEKVLGARRAGATRVILPKENEKDTAELPEQVRDEMEFVFVEAMREVLPAALEKADPSCPLRQAS